MSIEPTDIKIYLTGGLNNTNPNLSLGGIASNTEASSSTDGLFDSVLSAQAESGSVEYRAISIKNTSSELSPNVIVYISRETTGLSDTIAIGYENGTQSIANEVTAPSGVSFSTPLTKATGISLGSMASNTSKRLWLRWTVNAGSLKMNPTQGRLTISVDTI